MKQRKITSIVLALALLSGILGGCSRSAKDSDIPADQASRALTDVPADASGNTPSDETTGTSGNTPPDVPANTSGSAPTAGAPNRPNTANLTDEQKAEMVANQAEREAKLEETYNTLSTALRALVDEIRAAYKNTGAELTEEEKIAQQTKQEAVKSKVEALSDSDQALIADFLPPSLNGKGMQGGGPGGSGRGIPNGDSIGNTRDTGSAGSGESSAITG